MKTHNSLVGIIGLTLFASVLLLTSCSNDDEHDMLSSDTRSYSAQAIDLGLSVKWADCNVGAVSPEDYGGLYGWADPNGEERAAYECVDGNFMWISPLYGGMTPPECICGSDLDIATKQWGNGWRMPSDAEFEELIEKCTWEWVMLGGVQGMSITGPNGNSIFLPAGGDRFGNKQESRNEYGSYAAGTLYDYSDFYMWTLDFHPEDKRELCGSLRMLGVSVRPVQN